MDILRPEIRVTRMTQEQVEHVARTFYEAEYPGKWNDAPGMLRERFRDRARSALATLNRQIEACWSGARPLA
jgi:hypothetical protein